MRIKTASAPIIGAGTLLALTIGLRLPAAQAKEVDASQQSTGAMSAQSLRAQDEARWNAEAKGENLLMARAQAARALRLRGWYSEAKYYG